MRKVEKDNVEHDICIWIIVIEFLNSEKQICLKGSLLSKLEKYRNASNQSSFL